MYFKEILGEGAEKMQARRTQSRRRSLCGGALKNRNEKESQKTKEDDAKENNLLLPQACGGFQSSSFPSAGSQDFDCFTCNIKTAASAGETPEMPMAWARVRGLIRSNFCRASSLSPSMEA